MRLAAAALLIAGATALVPSGMTGRPMQGRREVMEQAAGVMGAILIAPKPALADGAVSPATAQRAKGIYGARIAALKGAVEKGDFAAVEEEKTAFTLFNSGAFKTNSKEAKAASVKATDSILAACASKDKAALKSSYDAFMKNAKIDTSSIDLSYGQGYASEFDWKARTNKGVIYQR